MFIRGYSYTCFLTAATHVRPVKIKKCLVKSYRNMYFLPKPFGNTLLNVVAATAALQLQSLRRHSVPLKRVFPKENKFNLPFSSFLSAELFVRTKVNKVTKRKYTYVTEH